MQREIRVGGKFKICKRLGKGSFGELFSGYNHKSNEEVAIKLEPLNTYKPVLCYEAKIYEKLEGMPGIPTIHFFGVEGDFFVLVMDILGPNIEELWNFCRQKFSMKTICWMGANMINRIESVHQRKYLHRDIKP